MIVDRLVNWEKYPNLSRNAVWIEAFQWIDAHASTAEEGKHPLSFSGMFVHVMSYDLKDREAANYESHLHTIDLQYTIEGAEQIEYTPQALLSKKGGYSDETDFQFYETPARGFASVDNNEGQFCILFPEDGHMPQLYVPPFKRVKKLVVKIPTLLFK